MTGTSSSGSGRGRSQGGHGDAETRRRGEGPTGLAQFIPARACATEQDLIGKSQPMQALQRLIHRFAPYDTPLLLEGEESTGKRLVAEIIHGLSPYQSGLFASLDCAALPEMVLAIELFGCAPGFHANLPQGLPGKLELLQGGTLLLEHVGLMPRWVQSRLTKVLESRMLERLGGRAVIPVHVRVMASTTVELCEHRPDSLIHEALFDHLLKHGLYKPPGDAENAVDNNP